MFDAGEAGYYTYPKLIACLQKHYMNDTFIFFATECTPTLRPSLRLVPFLVSSVTCTPVTISALMFSLADLLSSQPLQNHRPPAAWLCIHCNPSNSRSSSASHRFKLQAFCLQGDQGMLSYTSNDWGEHVF